MPEQGKGLGRVRPPDWRHVELYPASEVRAAVRNALVPPGPDVVVRHPLPVRYDQGQTPRCVDFGSCTYMSALELANEGQTVDFQPGHLYRWAVRHDEVPGDPGGTTVRAGMDYVRKLGLIPQARDYGRRRIRENRWLQTMDEVLGVLAIQPVPIGITWLHDMMEADREGFIHATGRDDGGHFTTLFGLNMPRGYVDIGNTWGPLFWPGAPSQEEAWNAKLGLEGLERLLFAMDGEAVWVTDRLERAV